MREAYREVEVGLKLEVKGKAFLDVCALGKAAEHEGEHLEEGGVNNQRNGGFDLQDG